MKDLVNALLILITLLNDGTLIAIGYDNVEARRTPEKWNLRILYLISSVLAGVACISSILLLYLSLSTWEDGSIYQRIGIGGLSYGQITTSIYLKVSISDFLTLFSARTGEHYFWSTKPANILLGAGCLALTISTIVSITWPSTYPDGVYTLGLGRRQPYTLPLYIWIYCLVWWVIQDLCKVGTYYLLKKYNIFGYHDTGVLVLPESTIKYIAENKEFDTMIAVKSH